MQSRWPQPSLPLLLLVQSMVSSLSSENTRENLQEVTLAAILPLTNTDYAWAWPRVAPALYQAVKRVNSDPWLLPGLKLRLVHGSSENRDGFCSDSMAPLVAVDLKLSQDPWAFIGPGCDYSSSPVARFTTHWEVPMVTAGARAIGFEQFAAVTNTGPTHKKLGEFAARIQETFGWRRQIMLIFSGNKDGNDDWPCYFTAEGIFMVLGRHNITIQERFIKDNLNYKSMVQDIRQNGRVVYLCCHWDILRNLMVQFWKEGVELEEYVFFFIDLFAESLGGRRPVRPWYRGDQDDYAALHAFRVSFIFSVSGERNPVSFGTTTATHMHRHTCTFKLTHSHCVSAGVMGVVDMDEFGDKQVDFAVWDMTDVECGEFQVVSVYNSSMKQLVMQSGRRFQWPGGSPPPDIPECGFKNDKPDCSRTLFLVYLLPLSLFPIPNFFSTHTPTHTHLSYCLLHRKLKLESELAAQLWRVTWDDVQLSNMDKVLKRACSRLTMIQLWLPDDHGGKRLMKNSLMLCLLQGNLAAIKYINKKRIELTRKVLFELKHMRDVQNDHLTRFIGSCIDPPNMCIITEYCPRGSLQDLMESDSLTLDWMLRYSLINDIVKGMAFLHNSVIVSHGNLKSSNCVVDSRFVLKITDYGLESLRTSSIPENTHAYYASQLWTAPELLRSECRPTCGTQRGDVYSFGIILQEVAVLRGVFYLDTHTPTPKEIIQTVRQGMVPPLRPSLCFHSHSEELGVLMQRCWCEEPSERPDFHTIKVLLRKGYGSNILDNLLSRMAQYANNLEELVEERTQAYHEEKRKAEALLYQILPHSVAEQLKRGETVQAEAFDSVTIYFSDIVGFTALSAESTPLQVVTLLNDLYTCFDAIIDNFDVYKVETIGDAYMVVSGLPVRNGKLHGREVARMSLALLDAVKTFRIRHHPNQQLRLRIGIHSGPVCAGVVGLKMPRYCLFGDTVNTASRMESNGEALKIHVSEATRQVLQDFSCFLLQLRGEIEVKGKGRMKTYWLLGEDFAEADRRLADDCLMTDS
uniref:Guanylate cyclase n=1 Tax=Mastacembelus armatus TaxID=205130 RepID=A0A7N8X9K1_9TELE